MVKGISYTYYPIAVPTIKGIESNMRIQILSSAQAGTTSSEIVQISHNGQVLNWDISPYSRSRDAQGEAAAATVFDEINSYLSKSRQNANTRSLRPSGPSVRNSIRATIPVR